MKLNKEFPRKLYLDTKVLVNGNKKKPRDLNLEKHIELGKWVQDLIDNGDLIIPCCDECKTPIAVETLTKFKDNGLSYQYIDILQNCVFNRYEPVSIELITIDPDIFNSLSGNREVELINIPYYSYPIVKLTKPSDLTILNNIDVEEEFMFRITDSCGVSQKAKVTIDIISHDLNLP